MQRDFREAQRRYRTDRAFRVECDRWLPVFEYKVTYKVPLSAALEKVGIKS